MLSTFQKNQRRKFIKKHGLVGSSIKLVETIEWALRCQEAQARMFIQGEDGTEVVEIAKLLHGNRSGKFTKLDCRGLDPEQIRDRMLGRISDNEDALATQSIDGTILIQYIEELSPRGQMVLRGCLDTIESSELKIRIVTSATCALEELVRTGKFEDALYSRISVVRMEIPPLRERLEDIDDLVEHFRKKGAKDCKRKPPVFDSSTIEFFKKSDWRFNCLQLENMVANLMCFNHEEKVIFPKHILKEKSALRIFSFLSPAVEKFCQMVPTTKYGF